MTFQGFEGVTLAGDLYVPTGPTRPRAATVLVHGSGPQDRHGYGSIMQFSAQTSSSVVVGGSTSGFAWPAQSSDSSSSSNVGAIVGGTVGGLAGFVVLTLGLGVCIFCGVGVLTAR